MNDIELKEHFKKVDNLVAYYMANMDYEHGTIQEALEHLFADLSGTDLDRVAAEIARKRNKTLNLWNS